ncbi:MAG: hypothetical protein GY832_42990, partial [Chloroflexi bacterium]|nr:hypothetical protein [Chloroflexota bacterium]
MVRRSKMDPVSRGTVLTAACICSKVVPLICPFHVLQAALACPCQCQPPISLFLHRDGLPVRRAEVLQTIRHFAAKLGLPAMDFAGHSLRRGGATSALMAGAPVSTIQVLGRWKSDSFRRYLEAPEAFMAQQVA